MIEINPESISESVRSLIENKNGLDARTIDPNKAISCY